ncbi:CheR family methyltransferase [Ureibacillus thermosphaericus]|uniref:protein-glutamate O-methyltransferase n=1 Tax=Ureibacillus thermosphaericus TaxID=51173 RepID=A0A840PUS7_URETH|nr:protein-glutamate O-methyltransferase CheR [Ureibacillus thermosphaericus]MBB5149677.1 chemotaxis protein methyltransferase CheR [Ureibacillus thermosphaericus]NKZ32472.1 protein-glutamate O-methyltransferase CheR [Ureibacillus thermosphaericus]
MDNLALYYLGKVVYDYCGLNYLNNISSLKMKVSKRLRQLNIESYWSYIRYLQEHPSEWDQLIVLLTINETYFFREDKQLYIYQQKILPQFASEVQQPIKIWSAGCSTGEEAYSLAMMTMDLDHYKPKKVHIIGSDINKKVLSIAKEGIYSKSSLAFRRIPPYWLQKYFDEMENNYRIKDEVKKMVSFQYVNLLEEVENGRNEEFDVIFCRNVLIYFDEETIEKVVKSFYRALKKGGYLFLGHAETISNLKIGFETLNENGTFYYRKG